ncbi:MAG TPA: hypothetical protein VMX13_17300 [Sedimentisphaerales bacterium]|nr:hypothetical protein [Sedimentisphaerales bacterium]
MSFRRIHKGSAFLISVIVLATLAAWAVSICSFSGVNLQIAENQRKADGARACAESGMEVMRFWLSRFSISGNTNPALVFSELQSALQQDLAYNGISNIALALDSSSINVAPVTLDSTESRSFSVVMTPIGTDAVRVDVTGIQRSVAKTISALYRYGVKKNTVFDYGVATRGPLHLSGNIELEGVNVSVESDVFIESQNQNEALSIIGNSQIAGQVKIANPDAYVTLQGGQASIGGENGDAALNHVTVGHEPPEFPEPNPDYFEHYATNIVDSSTDTTADAAFENIRIVAGTNPTFTGNVTLKGIVFIETPNVVTFAGNATITGIIVGDGQLTDNSATNQINFIGTVDSHAVTELPAEEQFAGLQDEENTFVLAPGFHVGFGGNFNTLNGAVAGNGIEFFGNAGGTINGSVINYSDQEMTLSGNSDLYFNRSGADQIPAGFVQDIVLHYDPQSYTELPF